MQPPRSRSLPFAEEGGNSLRPDSGVNTSVGHELERQVVYAQAWEEECNRYERKLARWRGAWEALQRDVTSTWAEITALDAALAKVAQEFDGEDPLKPATREALEEAKAGLKSTAAYFDHYGPSVEFPEPNDEDREFMRELVERGRRLFG